MSDVNTRLPGEGIVVVKKQLRITVHSKWGRTYVLELNSTGKLHMHSLFDSMRRCFYTLSSCSLVIYVVFHFFATEEARRWERAVRAFLPKGSSSDVTDDPVFELFVNQDHRRGSN